MIRSAIITGATSMVGAACVKACLAEGMEVCAMVRPGSTRLERLPANEKLTIVECALDQYGSVRLPREKYDTLFHLAWGATSHEERVIPEKQANNVLCAIAAVQLAARYGCERFVGAGSQAEYGPSETLLGPHSPTRPVNAYGVAKNAAQMLCRIECERKGISFGWARIFSVYGPYDNQRTLVDSLIEHLEDKKHLPLSSCEQPWDYLYSDDCGRAMFLIGEKGRPGAIYCVASGESHPLKWFVQKIGELYGMDLSLDMGRLALPSKPQGLQADITALRRDTGFQPEVPFVEGIRRTIEYKRRRQ